MKQPSKKAKQQTQAGLLRRLAKTVLANQEGHRLGLVRLQRTIGGLLRTSVRGDYLLTSLIADETFIIHREGKSVSILLKQPTKKEEVRKMVKRTKKSREQVELTTEQFALRAIETLRVDGHIGIHTVFSGFNEAFRTYFPRKDPVVEMNKLAAAGKIAIRPAKRGAIISPPDAASPSDAATTLRKMGLR